MTSATETVTLDDVERKVKALGGKVLDTIVDEDENVSIALGKGEAVSLTVCLMRDGTIDIHSWHSKKMGDLTITAEASFVGIEVLEGWLNAAL